MHWATHITPWCLLVFCSESELLHAGHTFTQPRVFIMETTSHEWHPINQSVKKNTPSNGLLDTVGYDGQGSIGQEHKAIFKKLTQDL
jgi:hypothetical protein